MVVDSQFQNLRDLSLHLQELLRSHFPQIAPIQVFCIQMSHKLLVLVQHSPRVMPDEQAVGQVLRTALEHDPPPFIHHWLTQAEQAQMELFLRVTGDNQVYASGIFDLTYERRSLHLPSISPLGVTSSGSETVPPTEPTEATPTDASEVGMDGGVPGAPAEPIAAESEMVGSTEQELEAEAPFQPLPLTDESLSATNASADGPLPNSQEPHPDDAITVANSAPSALDAADRSPSPGSALVPAGEPAAALAAPSTEDDSPPVVQERQAQRRQRWIAAGIAAAAAIASGIYALSRPCVVGECQNILQAQALDATASATIQDPQSAQEVVDAYDQWVEASYLLQQIPPWSGAYAEAQQSLRLYEERMGELRNVVQAQRQAYSAAVKSQDPPHPVDVWREIRILWQEAIALLEGVPQQSSVYPLAQQKLQEYKANLAAIDTRIASERSAQSKIQSAREAATVAEARQRVANSLETWQQTYATWEATINLLRQVPTNTMSHAEARQLLEIYQTKLSATRDRIQQETIAQSSYQQAITLANQAADYENSQQWSQAVITWRDALNQAQQVPQETTYHDQAQPLIMSYSQSLSKAEERLRSVVSRQEAAAQLAQFCNASRQCTSSASGDRLQIQVIQSNLGRGTFPLPGTAQPIAEPFNDLLRSVAAIGQQSQVKIDVFNIDGTLFGTYTPDVNGYVPASNASTPEPYRF